MKKIFIVLLLLLLVFAISCSEHSGKIIDKVYKPSSTGIGTSSKGSAVITSEFSEHILVIEEANGNIIEADVSKETYYKKNIGDTITINGIY